MTKLYIVFILVVLVNCLNFYITVNFFENEDIYSICLGMVVGMIDFLSIIWFFNGGSFSNSLEDDD